MEFRDLRRQYDALKQDLDAGIAEVLRSGKFISGPWVTELEEKLAAYVGRKYCITCGNGTDALELALRALDIGAGDAVFVPDFTFFSTGEVVPIVGAMPVFVDVGLDTYNISPEMLEEAICKVLSQGKYRPRAVMAVDLFGQPADYGKILGIAERYGLYVIEDGAQGFGGSSNGKMACGFGDISTTSFFPTKPLGCYGDGGAVFTDDEEWAAKIRSLCVHGKSHKGKYDNVRIGMNSRLDSIQAAVLLVKYRELKEELEKISAAAENYSNMLAGLVKTPAIIKNCHSAWAQYTVQFESQQQRAYIQDALSRDGIPSMVYYIKPMHEQAAFAGCCMTGCCRNTQKLCETVLSLPLSPYITQAEQEQVIDCIKRALETT